MKLNRDYLVHTIGEETLLVPTGKASFSGMVRGNQTFGTVLALLQTETTEEALIAAMKERFLAPEGLIEQDVREALARLREIGAIDG